MSTPLIPLPLPPPSPPPRPRSNSWRTERSNEVLEQGENAFLLGSVTSSHLSKGRMPLTLMQSVPRPSNGGAYAPKEKVEVAEAEKRGERPGSGLGWVPVTRPPAEEGVGRKSELAGENGEILNLDFVVYVSFVICIM